MKDKLAGINSILEAIKGKRKIEKIYVLENRKGKRIEELLSIAHKQGIFVQQVERQRLDKMYREGNHQGIIAITDAYQYSSLEEVLEYAALKGQKPFLLILDGVEDPRNFGAIIRTAECAGVHGIIIPRHNSVNVNEVVSRASAGAVEHMRIVQETNLVNVIKYLKKLNIWVIGADMNADNNYFNSGLERPIAIVIGGEGKGLRRLVKENCDLITKIPVTGKVNSLNASVAAALMMYEVVRSGL